VLPGPLVKAEQEGDLITICTDTSKACRQPQQHLLPLPTFAWFAQSQSDIASAAGPAVINSVELTRSGAPLRYYRQPLHFSADAGLSADHSLQSIPHSTARDGTSYARVSSSMDLASAPPAEALSARPQVKTRFGSRHNSPSVITLCSTGRDPEPADVQPIIWYQLSVMLRLRVTMSIQLHQLGHGPRCDHS